MLESVTCVFSLHVARDACRCTGNKTLLKSWLVYECPDPYLQSKNSCPQVMQQGQTLTAQKRNASSGSLDSDTTQGHIHKIRCLPASRSRLSYSQHWANKIAL